MRQRTKHRHRGFSLLELVIVVVIIALIAAVAVPRLSRGTEGAAEAALLRYLSILRRGIDLFVAEHNGKVPSDTEITDALTKYSNAAGDDFSDTKDATHYYGPYVRSIPPLPVGAKKGATGIGSNSAAWVGWIYDPSDGSVQSNTGPGEVDASGKPYQDY